MQIEKAPANQENIVSLTAGGANAHNTNKSILFPVRFFVWLCCEHLQLVCSQIEEVVFLMCSELSATVDIYILYHAHFLISNGSGSIFPSINFSHRNFFFKSL